MKGEVMATDMVNCIATTHSTAPAGDFPLNQNCWYPDYNIQPYRWWNPYPVTYTVSTTPCEHCWCRKAEKDWVSKKPHRQCCHCLNTRATEFIKAEQEQ